MTPTSPLNGEVIIILGGTSGLGLSGARACVDAGARVVIVGLEHGAVGETVAHLGDAAVGCTGNATDPNTAVRAVEVAVRQFGRMDGLYHVAGGSGRRWGDGPLDQLTDEGCAATVELNLLTAISSNRAAVRYWLAEKRGGVLLNLGSVLAAHPSPRFFATHAYAAAKSGLLGFTRSLAAYYAPHGIRANVLAPGLIDTPMARRAVHDPAIHAFVRCKQPLEGGRPGQPEDCDAAVVYLLSRYSRFVTGQVLEVDGGWSVSEGLVRT